jgi:hypothetical protein
VSAARSKVTVACIVGEQECSVLTLDFFPAKKGRSI